MDEKLYYDGSYILNSNKLINIILGNRAAGKSFYFKRFMLRYYFKYKDKTPHCRFAFIYREIQEVRNCSEGIFTDIQELYYKDLNITFKKSEVLGRYYLDGECIGYALSLKNYQTYKKMPELQTINCMLFDEFLSEDSNYLPNEPEKLMNMVQSFARGGGEFIRDSFKVFLVANAVSFNNPYFDYFDEIKKNFKFNTRKIKAERVAFEMCVNENAIDAIKNSSFGKAIEGTAYASYALTNDFYLDDNKFIEKVAGQKEYMLNIILAGKLYAVYLSEQQGFYYISKKVDKNRETITFDNASHDINYIFVKRHANFIQRMDEMYRMGCVRFEDMDCKIVFLTMLNLLTK